MNLISDLLHMIELRIIRTFIPRHIFKLVDPNDYANCLDDPTWDAREPVKVVN